MHPSLWYNEDYFWRERIPIFTVLLVDDEPLVLEGLTFMIDWESHGFRICGEACDGEEALNRIQELNPDLVVLDISMPVMDGLQLIEHCTKALNVPSRFIVLSGHDDFAFAQKALTCGVLDYWLKPIDVEEINATLGKLGKEWSHPNEEEAVPTHTLSTAWTVPDADDPLFAAEDSLLLAIQAGDLSVIDEAAGRLCSQVERSFKGDREASKAFLSNVLLELIWKVMEGEMTNPAPDDEHTLSLPVLPNRPERWPDILASFARETMKQLTRQKAMTGPVGEAARIIRERYCEPLQLQAVAKMLHFQPAYLGQLFKKQTGMSFLDYVHRTRIEASRRLLRRTDLKIADVARTVGYADPEQFAAKFKQWMDMPPSQYKNG